jgi:dTMP kinase
MQKGKFIVFEGVDGSGKATQTKFLFDYFVGQGKKVEKIDFPQYGKKSAGMVEEYLTGKYGKAEEVGAYAASIFYACDRFDASFKIKKWLSEDKIVLADRYLASNIGHQGGKIKDKQKRKDYIRWLYNLEYGIFNIPKPDATIVLKTNPQISSKLSQCIGDKEKQNKKNIYLQGGKKKDVHESNQDHLQNALSAYLQLAKDFPNDFEVIDCLQGEKILPPLVIHQRVLEIIKIKKF